MFFAERNRYAPISLKFQYSPSWRQRDKAAEPVPYKRPNLFSFNPGSNFWMGLRVNIRIHPGWRLALFLCIVLAMRLMAISSDFRFNIEHQYAGFQSTPGFQNPLSRHRKKPSVRQEYRLSGQGAFLRPRLNQHPPPCLANRCIRAKLPLAFTA